MDTRIRIESRLTNLAVVEKAIDTFTKDTSISRDSYGKILVSVMEAVNNAIIHGNKSDQTKFVEIELKMTNGSLTVVVQDEGAGFKHIDVPDPTQPENILKASGRGVFLMKKLADEIEFNKKGNCVIMTFKNIKT